MKKADKLIFSWGDSRRFNSYKRFLQSKFGGRVQKLAIDAGFTCPNRDGTLAYGGCSYCVNSAFNPSYCSSSKSVVQQIEEGIEFHKNRYRRAENYFAYFQPYSNTYASLLKLKEIYQPAIEHPLIKGLVIGTRPDCINDEILDYFAELQQKMYISIEYGVETCNNATLERINRKHTFEQAVKAINDTADRKIHVGAHLIFGLPNETPELWFADIHKINNLPLNSIKFHQLQIVKNSALEAEYMANSDDFYTFTLENYIDFITNYLEKLNPQFVVERFAGEVPPRYLAVNQWGTMRYDVILNKIEKILEAKNRVQGAKFENYKRK